MTYAATARNGWIAEMKRQKQARKQQEEVAQETGNGDKEAASVEQSPTAVALNHDIPLLPFMPTTRTEILMEAKRLFNHALYRQRVARKAQEQSESATPSPILSTQLVNSYLAVQSSFRVYTEVARVYDHVYEEENLTRDGWTYSLALQAHTERNGRTAKAWEIWQTLQAWWKAEDGNPTMSPADKARRRRQLGCEPKQRHEAYRLMINGLAR
jgi:hypothetical protein